MNMNADGKKCGCPCHKAGGVLLVLFGLTFLLKALGVIEEHLSNIIWPSIIILAGIKHTCKGMCKCCAGEGKHCS